MAARFRILDGARAGQVRLIQTEFATIGRATSSDLPFDPDRDLDVSTRHAALFRQQGTWMLRDLGSTNGTFVNGDRIREDRALRDGDRVRFGANGPEAEFAVVEDRPLDAPPIAVAPAPPPAEPVTAAMPAPARPSAHAGEPARAPTDPTPGPLTLRVRAEVAEQTSRLRRVVFASLAAFLLLVLAIGGWQWRRAARLDARRDALAVRVDSLLTLLTAPGAAPAIQDALSAARAGADSLRTRLAAGRLGTEALDTLTTQITTHAMAQAAIVRLAQTDPATVVTANAAAVGLVITMHDGGGVSAGSGFTVMIRGDTGWVVTARHLVIDSAGAQAIKIGIVYNGSTQNFRATLVGVHPEADLALIQVIVREGVPVIHGLSARPLPAGPGDPVVTIGFPTGPDLPLGDWRTEGVHAVSGLGSIGRVLPDLLQLDAYGAPGASGSPVFDASGLLVGVVSGGDPASHGRVVYAVPVARVKELIAGR